MGLPTPTDTTAPRASRLGLYLAIEKAGLVEACQRVVPRPPHSGRGAGGYSSQTYVGEVARARQHLAAGAVPHRYGVPGTGAGLLAGLEAGGGPLLAGAGAGLLAATGRYSTLSTSMALRGMTTRWYFWGTGVRSAFSFLEDIGGQRTRSPPVSSGSVVNAATAPA
jgi:hypothetical protein